MSQEQTTDLPSVDWVDFWVETLSGYSKELRLEIIRAIIPPGWCVMPPPDVEGVAAKVPLVLYFANHGDAREMAEACRAAMLNPVEYRL